MHGVGQQLLPLHLVRQVGWEWTQLLWAHCSMANTKLLTKEKQPPQCARSALGLWKMLNLKHVSTKHYQIPLILYSRSFSHKSQRVRIAHSTWKNEDHSFLHWCSNWWKQLSTCIDGKWEECVMGVYVMYIPIITWKKNLS